MLEEICGHIRNFFVRSVQSGTFEIKDGKITPLDLLNGQYFRIVGSVFNDGVHNTADGLCDEVFHGEIWAMAPPHAFLSLAEEIKAYNESDEAKPSAYTSESFGPYSYTKATDESGAALSWQSVFAKKLNRWRKI